MVLEIQKYIMRTNNFKSNYFTHLYPGSSFMSWQDLPYSPFCKKNNKKEQKEQIRRSLIDLRICLLNIVSTQHIVNYSIYYIYCQLFRSLNDL